MPIKSFRGKLGSDVQEKISLATNDGSIGYRIVKFQIFPGNFNVTDEYNVKIYKIKQDITAINLMKYDFGDNTMIAAAYFENSSNVGSEGSWHDTVVFDNEVFNQDIFITAEAQSGNEINFYLELEQIKLDLNQNTLVTLKDIRNTNSQ
jgi:hypothetical protein